MKDVRVWIECKICALWDGDTKEGTPTRYAHSVQFAPLGNLSVEKKKKDSVLSIVPETAAKQ